MLRHFARLLALALVPVLVIAMPEAAHAATYGPSVAVKFKADFNGLGGGASCSLRANWVANPASDYLGVVVKGSCDVSLIAHAANGGTNADLVFSGTDANGRACSATVLQDDSSAIAGQAAFTSKTCRASVVEWRLWTDNNVPGFFDFNVDESGTVVADLGKPDSEAPSAPAQAGCSWLTMESVGHPAVEYDDLNYRWRIRIPTTVTILVSTGLRAYVQLWYRNSAGELQHMDRGNDFNEAASRGYLELFTPTQQSALEIVNKVVGVGVIENNKTYSTRSSGQEDFQLRTTDNPTALGGINWPDQCVYYYGARIASDGPGPVYSTPAGGMAGTSGGGGTGTTTPPTDAPDEPEPASDGCGFSVTSPSTWGGAAACATVKALVALVAVVRTLVTLVRRVVSLLGDALGAVDAVLGAVAGIAASVATKVSEALRVLFVPSPSSWDLNGVKAQAESRPPYSVLAALAGGFSSVISSYGGGSCGVLTTVEGQSLSTCKLSAVPGWSAMMGVAQVAMFAFTGLGIFRMFAGAMTRGGDA